MTNGHNFHVLQGENGYINYPFHVTNLPLDERKVTPNIWLGPQETKLLFILETKKMSVFAFDGVRSILEGTDLTIWNVIEGLKKRRDYNFCLCKNVCLHQRYGTGWSHTVSATCGKFRTVVSAGFFS